MQMRHRFAQRLEAVDPHLGRRERMAPGDEADAVFGVVGLLAKRSDVIRRGHHRFEDDLDRNGGRGIERLGDFLRMFRDGLEGFGAVEMLTASDEPDFKLFQINHKSFPF